MVRTVYCNCCVPVASHPESPVDATGTSMFHIRTVFLYGMYVSVLDNSHRKVRLFPFIDFADGFFNGDGLCLTRSKCR